MQESNFIKQMREVCGYVDGLKNEIDALQTSRHTYIQEKEFAHLQRRVLRLIALGLGKISDEELANRLNNYVTPDILVKALDWPSKFSSEKITDHSVRFTLDVYNPRLTLSWHNHHTIDTLPVMISILNAMHEYPAPKW
jgi:hypothetical protein